MISSSTIIRQVTRKVVIRVLGAFFLCRQLVDLALRFERTIGGLGATFLMRCSGLCVTFLGRAIQLIWLYNQQSATNRRYAKVLFSNLLETKAGLSPDCFNEKMNWGIELLMEMINTSKRNATTMVGNQLKVT